MTDKHLNNMKGNSFKRLEDENIRSNPNALSRAEKGVDDSIGFIKMVSNVLELYLPRVFDVIVTMSGGKVKHEKDGAPPSDIDSNGSTIFKENGPSRPPHEQ